MDGNRRISNFGARRWMIFMPYVAAFLCGVIATAILWTFLFHVNIPENTIDQVDFDEAPSGSYLDEELDCPKAIMSKYQGRALNLTDSNLLSQVQEDVWILEHVFPDLPKGDTHTFVEIGALDGRLYSNTYYMEKVLGWKGVLIEASTPNYAKLEKEGGRTNSLLMHAGACVTPKMIKLYGEGAIADGKPKDDKYVSNVLCFPMHVLLDLAGLTHIDFYSIDVEGAELDLLKSHDFKKHPAKSILIEMSTQTLEKNVLVRNQLYSKGHCRIVEKMGCDNEVWVPRSARINEV